MRHKSPADWCIEPSCWDESILRCLQLPSIVKENFRRWGEIDHLEEKNRQQQQQQQPKTKNQQPTTNNKNTKKKKKKKKKLKKNKQKSRHGCMSGLFLFWSGSNSNKPELHWLESDLLLHFKTFVAPHPISPLKNPSLFLAGKYFWNPPVIDFHPKKTSPESVSLKFQPCPCRIGGSWALFWVIADRKNLLLVVTTLPKTYWNVSPQKKCLQNEISLSKKNKSLF